MRRYLDGIVINEMPDAMMRNAPQFGPNAKRADGRFFSLGENSAQAKAEDVGELAFHTWCWWCVHTPGFPSTQAAGFIRRRVAGPGM